MLETHLPSPRPRYGDRAALDDTRRVLDRPVRADEPAAGGDGAQERDAIRNRAAQLPLEERRESVPATPAVRKGLRPRLRALDGLRLAVALFVGYYHFLAERKADTAWGQQAETIFPGADVLAPYGWLGVEIFFVISGFVICMSCWGRTLLEFFRSRVQRLYPAYWVSILVTYVVISVAPVIGEAPTASELLVNLTMLQSPMGVPHVDPVYWTLWVELRFYLLFALVVGMGLTYRRVLAFGAVWTLVTPFARLGDSELLKIVVVPEYSCYFLVGIGLYLLHRFGHQPLTWVLLTVNVAMCLFRADRRLQENFDRGFVDAPMHFWVAAGIFLVAFALILAIALGKLDWMNWTWLTWAGALSYPFYLLHEMIGYSLIHWLYVDRDVSAYAVLPSAFGCTLLLAWLVHRLAERPLAAVLKKRLSGGNLLDPAPRVPVP